jgi:isoleucyl-tRNA synthetase
MSQDFDFKNTLNLPQTQFPMRADLVAREPKRQAQWESFGLYDKIQAKRKDSPTYILHDGPPYTNGDIHVGTAFNKILKDTLVRYKSLRGFRTPFIPGWDCHGLPIEHKVCRDLEAQKKSLDAPGIRKACAEFSAMHRDKQRNQSKRLSLLADWKHEYQTMDPHFEAGILRTFAGFVEGGYIYRSKKPVYWSIPCKTALAEGEVEYKDITSPAIFVKFPFANGKSFGATKPAFVVIWTTTPWTLPSNLAVAVHPELLYTFLETENESYLVAQELVASLVTQLKLETYTCTEPFQGKALQNAAAQHPFIDRKSPILLAEYVSSDAGTGCVHTAPGHGLDDYFAGQKYGLEAYSPLDDEGRYLSDGQVPESLVGLSVLSHNGKNAANEAVLSLLKGESHLLHQTAIQHAYPHCWRSKTPVIFRATDQWFIALDHNGLRGKMIESLSGVTWTPKSGENRMKGSLESRPDWCITRQRAWGTPMPIFYDDKGEAYMDADVIRALAQKIESTGTDVWFTQTAEELLAGIPLPEAWKGKALRPSTDTLDVWIDSGSSHLAVLKDPKRENLSWPADLYLEGSDQHRGWFQSSLWTAMVNEGKPPYKQVLTHGFIVDEDRQKISKSGEKPQTADAYVGRFGADVMRLWAFSEDYQADVPLSEAILNQVTQVYRTIRNTLRFQLGNLYDFDAEKDLLPTDRLLPLDQWLIAQLKELVEQMTFSYENFTFHRAYQLLSRFITVTLSATYHDMIKDRLYVSAPHWEERRSAQTALYHTLHTLLKLLAPVLPFTADEAYCFAKADRDDLDDSIHLAEWPNLDALSVDASVALDIKNLLEIRESVLQSLEPLRQDKKIGQSSDAQIHIKGSPNDSKFVLLKRYEAFLAECFIVSSVLLDAQPDTPLHIEATPATGVRCPRSWKWVPELVPCPGYPPVSPRSQKALLDRLKP